MIQVARAEGGSAETLAVGRRLLGTRCISCHVQEPISKYTESEWIIRIQSMSKRARLHPLEQKQITDYVIAARRCLNP
jgi:hypothetical protein